VEKQGKIHALIHLSDTTYIKNGRYNLSSVTKIVSSDWKLKGNETSISLKKKTKTHI
jgi:hypothetical protein